jgi:hypothetical protein
MLSNAQKKRLEMENIRLKQDNMAYQEQLHGERNRCNLLNAKVAIYRRRYSWALVCMYTLGIALSISVVWKQL